MYLKDEQIEFYRAQGYLLLPGLFSRAEIEVLKREVPVILAEASPGRILERDAKTVRSVYGSHLTNPIFERLTRHPRILEPSQQIVGSEAYVYQFKINAKAASSGDVWEWHQDYVFWQREDGLPEPQLINATVFLDEVDQYNGPILVIPGSHLGGSNENDSKPQSKDTVTAEGAPAWTSHLTANLKYSLDQSKVDDLSRSLGVVIAAGPPGSTLFFHPNVVHGSARNTSGSNRTLIICTYNSVKNLPLFPKNRRPEFLVSSNFQPLEVLPDDCLQECQQVENSFTRSTCPQ